MTWSSGGRWAALVAATAVVVHGQELGWQKNQVNATMCAWKGSRAAVLRDTVYIDGGYLYWTPGFSDGTYGVVTQDDNPLGLIYSLNFSKPFNSTTNVSEILDTMSKVGNGNFANNVAPNYYDGAMLANDAEFFLYGGLLNPIDTSNLPDANEVLYYEAFQYGVERTFRPGFGQERLPTNMTRYITYGGAANAPSENKAWYFGGMHSPTWGESVMPLTNASTNPVNLSNTLITLDMSIQTSETWSNVTLPGGIPGRANPEVVWVPVGEQGILVVLGGVVDPDYNNAYDESDNVAQSQQDSPKFMSNINIYDIAGNAWYTQPTIAGPGQLTLGCAVVAVAQDASSYNIYYYGGYDGLNEDQDFNDDVWILSLPSFMWMKVSSGTATHARAAHKCFTPYPDQMVVIGGYTSLKGNDMSCLDGGLLQVFNLTAGKWMDSYDPNNWGNYGVPEMIYIMIGGSETGSATMTTPTPTGWATADLAKVFQTKYPSSKITTYYPYGSYTSNSTRTDVSASNGLPSWVAPVLGVILGLIFLSAIAVGILLYWRRKYLRNRDTTNGSSEENGNRILAWIRGQDNSHKAMTVTTEETHMNPDEMDTRAAPAADMRESKPLGMVQAEMPDTPLVELMGDTSPYVELDNTGLSHVDVLENHTHFATFGSPTTTVPSSVSHYTGHSHPAASISTDSASRAAGTPHLGAARPDSPAVPGPMGQTQKHAPYQSSNLVPDDRIDNIASVTENSNHQQHQSDAEASHDPRVVSDLSSVSQREQSHLRNLSDATVSSVAAPSELTEGRLSSDTAAAAAAATATAAAGPGPAHYPNIATTTTSGNAGGGGNNSPYITPNPTNDFGTPPGPVSPPSGDDRGGAAGDYLSYQPSRTYPTADLAARAHGQAGQQSSQQQGLGAGSLRRSAFRESREDLDGDHREGR